MRPGRRVCMLAPPTGVCAGAARRAASQMRAVLALALALGTAGLRPQLAACAALATPRLGWGGGEPAILELLLKSEIRRSLAGGSPWPVASSLRFRWLAAAPSLFATTSWLCQGGGGCRAVAGPSSGLSGRGHEALDLKPVIWACETSCRAVLR